MERWEVRGFTILSCTIFLVGNRKWTPHKKEECVLYKRFVQLVKKYIRFHVSILFGSPNNKLHVDVTSMIDDNMVC